jgi:hypothetical protein
MKLNDDTDNHIISNRGLFISLMMLFVLYVGFMLLLGEWIT